MRVTKTTSVHCLGVTSWTLPVRGADAIRLAADCGLTAMHVDVGDLAAGPESLLEGGRSQHVRLAGLAVCRLETIGLLDLPAARSAIDDALQHARALDISLIYLPSFGAAEIHTPADLRATAELLKHALAESPSELAVASENSLDRDTAMRLFELVADERLHLLLDTQNAALAGHSLVALIQSFADRLSLKAPFL